MSNPKDEDQLTLDDAMDTTVGSQQLVAVNFANVEPLLVVANPLAASANPGSPGRSSRVASFAPPPATEHQTRGRRLSTWRDSLGSEQQAISADGSAVLQHSRHSLASMTNYQLIDLVIQLERQLIEVKTQASKLASTSASRNISSQVDESPINQPLTSTKSTHSLQKSVVEHEKMLNQYLVLELLGKGAYGKVKHGYDTKENRHVAIKIVRKPKGFGQNPTMDDAILREIVVMKMLRHENIVSLLEVINDPKATKIYIVLELIEGSTIGRVKREDLSCTLVKPTILAEYCIQLARGLVYIHANQVSHRDIKPENVLVEAMTGRVVFADFGVSQFFKPSEGKLVVGAMHGTKLFMAPELFADGEGAGPAVDVWALGVTIFGLLVGRLPFTSEQEIRDPDFSPVDHHELARKGHGRWVTIFKRIFHRDVQKRPSSSDLRGIFSQLLYELNDDEEALMLSSSNLDPSELTSSRSEKQPAVKDCSDGAQPAPPPHSGSSKELHFYRRRVTVVDRARRIPREDLYLTALTAATAVPSKGDDSSSSLSFDDLSPHVPTGGAFSDEETEESREMMPSKEGEKKCSAGLC
jgi:serine/threonine protein kinase